MISALDNNQRILSVGATEAVLSAVWVAARSGRQKSKEKWRENVALGSISCEVCAHQEAKKKITPL